MFQQDPRTKQLFGLRRHFDASVSSVRKSPVHMHAVRVLNVIDSMLTLEGPAEGLFKILEQTGYRHVLFGVKEATIPLMGESFVMALKDWLGRARWCDELQDAWEQIFEVINFHFVRGMKKAEAEVRTM